MILAFRFVASKARGMFRPAARPIPADFPCCARAAPVTMDFFVIKDSARIKDADRATGSAGRRLAVELGPSTRGVPCVLLHPFPFNRRFFADTARGIEARARTIVPDLRGFGDSDPGDGPFSIADLADDVAALLDQLQIDRAVLVGLSMGGYVALAFAARHARRLRGLVLADTRAGADSPEARAGRESALRVLGEQGATGLLEAQLPKLLAPGASDEVHARARALGEPRAATLATAIAALRDRPDRRAELPAIPCPTLVLVGTEDAITPPSEAAVLATTIPRAVLVELPGAGHLSSLEAPAPFTQALLGFLGRADG
jgi:pimeloyl-ACP methyl ester carboxylesterase